MGLVETEGRGRGGGRGGREAVGGIITGGGIGIAGTTGGGREGPSVFSIAVGVGTGVVVGVGIEDVGCSSLARGVVNRT